MELAFWDKLYECKRIFIDVSILILMELAFWVWWSHYRSWWNCLNPYSDGTCILRPKLQRSTPLPTKSQSLFWWNLHSERKVLSGLRRQPFRSQSLFWWNLHSEQLIAAIGEELGVSQSLFWWNLHSEKHRMNYSTCLMSVSILILMELAFWEGQQLIAAIGEELVSILILMELAFWGLTSFTKNSPKGSLNPYSDGTCILRSNQLKAR